VCGAPNVPEPGRKVLWAQIGAELPAGKDGSKITLAAKAVKGIESPGMLCAEDELGLSEDHAGIVILDEDDRTALGSPAQKALGIDDWLLEVNAPANRGDLLGHIGVARELVAMIRGKLVWPDVDLSAYAGGGTANVELAIASGEECPRYVARLIEGVSVKSSPRRIAQRLRAVGVRPISNLVDITNYVMFELGQPLHAFDAAKLTTGIVGVSPANDGEKFTTLDGIDRTLVKTDLVIRDGDRGIALAGVMGGMDTEVTGGTTRVLLESATFKPIMVRRTARRLGLHSEASQRFERGVDPELNNIASARATRLLCMHGGGKVTGDAVDAYPGKRETPSINVRLPRVQLLTGVPLGADACCDALERLTFKVTGTGDHLTVTPPSVRADVTREVDVIEEVLRITGYEQVPSSLPAMRQAPPMRPADRADAARRVLCAAGGSEAITYAFQSADRAGSLLLSATDRRAQPIAIMNPMSAEQAVMRTSLLPNLLAAVTRNQSYGRSDVALFEVGSVFLRKGEAVTERPLHELADEPRIAAGVLAGNRPGQVGNGSAWDAFDAKALALEAIRAVAGELVIDREVVGCFGEVHPDVREKLNVTGAVFAFEVELDKLRLAEPAQMRAIPRFPGSVRDVSLLLAEDIPAARIVEVIEAAHEPLLHRVRILEEYRDEAKLGAGMKSMLWSIAYRSPERTLTDAEVDRAHETIVARLVENLPAQRR
jgi:phenylalanyl-tRNA synthetase beta chain